MMANLLAEAYGHRSGSGRAAERALRLGRRAPGAGLHQHRGLAWHRARARLAGDYADLLAWCHRTGFLADEAIAKVARCAAGHPRQAAAALEQARELREAVAGLLRVVLDGRPADPEQLRTFNRHLGRALDQAVLQARAARTAWSWRPAATPWRKSPCAWPSRPPTC